MITHIQKTLGSETGVPNCSRSRLSHPVDAVSKRARTLFRFPPFCSLSIPNRGYRISAFIIFVLVLLAPLSSLAQRTGGNRGGGFGGGGFGGGGFGGFGGGGFGGGAGGGLRGGSSTARQYPGNGEVGDALITSDPEGRRVIVITDDETSQYIAQVVTNLDKPQPQVLIKVVFLEVTHRNASDIGVEGTVTKKFDSTTTGIASNVFGLAQQGPLPIPPGAGMYQILGNDFNVTLRAIAQAGKVEVLSRPSILARNSQQASILVGQEVPLITNVRYDTLGNQINTVQYQDVGIILRVTPFITTDGQVEMIVSPETSSLTDQSIPISLGVTAPVIARRSADTVVVTPNGQTVIIGGMMQNNKVSSDSKIPLLGDIPGLGRLFTRKITDYTKTELMIFLTPYIVSYPKQLADLTGKEKQDIELAPKAFSEQELNRFIDGLPPKPKPEPPADKASKKNG